MKRILSISIFFCCLLLCAKAVFADEGMWLLSQIKDLPYGEMKKGGLELTPSQIYNPDNGGLSRAILQVGGGTGSFISPNGLILTNHHVVYRAIQSQSPLKENYLSWYAPHRRS